MKVDLFARSKSLEVGELEVDFMQAMQVAPRLATRCYCENQLGSNLVNTWLLLLTAATTEGLIVDVPDAATLQH